MDSSDRRPHRSGPVGAPLDLDEAVELTRTGDLWLFRGRSAADHAIRALTNAPVNHVAVAVVLDDLPPLVWHAELGRGLVDVWTGTRHRGAQLHDLRQAVDQWRGRYAQRAWLRQLEVPGGLGRASEDALLREVALRDGTPFPSTAALAGRWLAGQAQRRVGPRLGRRVGRVARVATGAASAETTYCAEVVAGAYQALGLLPSDRPTSSYDPGTFWSGDHLALLRGARLGEEIAVR